MTNSARPPLTQEQWIALVLRYLKMQKARRRLQAEQQEDES